MNVGDFITELARRSIHVFLDGEQLGIRAPKGALTAELRAELAARKAALLEALRRRDQAVDAPLCITPDPAAAHAPFPLSDIQQAYWMGRSGVFELGDSACQSYVEVEGQGVDLDRLEHAWNRLIQRHGMLRAIVRPDGQQQILAEVPRYELARADLRGVGAARAAERLEAIREAMSHAVHSTDVWPLFEVRASVFDDGRVRVHLRIELMIADAWSVGILFRDWHRLYQELDADVGTTEITFRDYVVAEHAARDSEAYQRSREYWRARLAELPLAPELPMARAPSSLRRARFVRRGGHLDQARWHALKDRAQRAGLTPSATLCAAFADVLATWSKSAAFTLNLTFFNRPPVHPRIGDVVGDFASTVLLAVDGRGPTFEARAQSLQERLGQDLEHSRYSGVSVLRDLNRHHRSAVIMPVVFTSTLSSRGSGMFDLGWLGRTVYGVSQTPQVWLDHQITEDASGLVFTWDTVDELFPPAMFDDAFAAYCELLQDLARGDRPARPAASAPPRRDRDENAWRLGPGALAPRAHLEQRAQVNATDGPLPDALLHAPFARRPHDERPAVIAGELILDHRTLDRYARILAQDIRRAMDPAGTGGPARDALVAVVMDKGWEQVVAVLAVLYAGYAYLPVDPSAPASRLGYLLEQSKVSVALARPEPVGELAWPAGIAIVSVTREALDRRTGPDLPIPSAASPDDLAYVIYTSGSTGKPKGVMIEHRAALNTCLDVNERFSVGPADRVLALSSLTFDLSVYDVFGPLAAGGCVVMPDAARARDPEHWLELMAAHGVTIWSSAPPLMEMLLDAVESRDVRIPDSVRLCMLSGDWIPVSMPERIRRRGPAIRVVSLGGATEAAIWSISYPIGEVAPEWTSIPYGKPMRNQRFHVLNEHLEPCPIWVPGHLYIGGAGLARGYLGDEALSQARFFVHPRTGERLYRTGDLGRYWPDGDIEFLGRDDLQVKIRGYRVELGEIEAALLEHPAVQKAVVTAVGEARGHRRLAAYVVLDGSGAPVAAELEAFLAARLPDYMVPSWIIPLERLPLGATGKIDRAALPAPASAAPAQAVVQPQGELETRIAEIWQTHLRVPAVGVNQNFFDLGGDSVLLLHVLRELRLSIAPDLTVIELFRFPTIAALIRHLSERRDTSATQQARSQERADARKAFIRSRGRGRS